MLARGREQRGYSKHQETGGRVFNSQVEDPLDQVASLQAANRRPARSSKVAIAVPSLKQTYTKSLGSNMSKLIRMNGSSLRNRRKNKRDEKREQCARAATRKSDSIDSSSSKGGRKSSGGRRGKLNMMIGNLLTSVAQPGRVSAQSNRCGCGR